MTKAQQVVMRLPLREPPLEVLLTQRQLDALAAPLFKRALLPLEDACQQVRDVLCALVAQPLTSQGCQTRICAAGRQTVGV